MLSVKNIVKQYANHLALNDVSLEIEQGVIFGLLGPNGAGKTSLIRIINQITAPDSGSIYFNGEKLDSSHIGLIGYLPEERGLYKKMEIGEQMIYLARLKGLSRNEAIDRCKYWFGKLNMESWWKKKVEDLSKGMQQKVQFVATVIHHPQLIILDEPFSGFDPVNADIIKDEIISLNKQGATVIFSTHRMESVEQLCDSIALLNNAEKILEGKVKDIRNSYRDSTYKVHYSESEFLPVNNEVFSVLRVNLNENVTELTIKLADGKGPNEALKYLMQEVQIEHLSEVVPSIHEIFVQQVKRH